MDPVVPEVRQFILSALPPSASQKRLALTVLIAILAIVLIVAGPLSRWHTSPVPAFVPIYVTTMIATDSITAILLFTQFAILRSPAILVTATGYAFAARAPVPYLLTFPGLFGAKGVIDGPLSTAWFFILWRAGFPAFVVGYALLKDTESATAHVRGTVSAIVAISASMARTRRNTTRTSTSTSTTARCA